MSTVFEWNLEDFSGNLQTIQNTWETIVILEIMLECKEKFLALYHNLIN